MVTKHLPDLMENPKFKELIEGFAEVIKTSAEQGLDEARKKCSAFFLAAENFRAPVARIENVEILGKDENPLALRIYIPEAAKDLPVIVYFHRGGWIFGNIEEADPVCRLLSCHLDCIIVSVEYRLAPEYAFPKPLEDCYAATEWVADNAKKIGGDSNQLIVCGESAGGNFAGAVAMMARDKKGPFIAAQLLIYPIISANIQDEPYTTSPDRHFITKEGMQFMWGAYLQSSDNATHPYASLDCADNLSDLPPAVVITGEYDPLRQEAEKYAAALLQAGVPVSTLRVPEVIHGFLDLPLYTLEQKTAWLREIRNLLIQIL